MRTWFVGTSKPEDALARAMFDEGSDVLPANVPSAGADDPNVGLEVAWSNPWILDAYGDPARFSTDEGAGDKGGDGSSEGTPSKNNNFVKVGDPGSVGVAGGSSGAAEASVGGVNFPREPFRRSRCVPRPFCVSSSPSPSSSPRSARTSPRTRSAQAAISLLFCRASL